MDAIDTQAAAAAAVTQVDDAIERGPRLLTLRQAAEWLEAQGVIDLGFEGLRSLADRKRISTIQRSGKRHVEMRTLRGLVAARGGGMTPAAAPAPTVPQIDVEALLDRIVDAERRAASAETRGMIAERSESTLAEELHEARARVAALEAEVEAMARARWWKRRRSR